MVRANRYALALPHGGYGDLSGTERQRGIIAHFRAIADAMLHLATEVLLGR